MPDFFHKIGFFMVVVDARQLFSCWLTNSCPLFENFLPKFSFLSVKRCILLAECSGKRGEVLRPEGGGGVETTPWHSQGLRERGGDCTENKPLSMRPDPSRLGTTLHCVGEGVYAFRPGHISLLLYNQINLKCLQPDLCNARSSWRISGQFWYTSKSCKVQKLGPWDL